VSEHRRRHGPAGYCISKAFGVAARRVCLSLRLLLAPEQREPGQTYPRSITVGDSQVAALKSDYANLLYAFAVCNSSKRSRPARPSHELLMGNLRIEAEEDCRLMPHARRIIRVLVRRRRVRSLRARWIRIAALAQRFDPNCTSSCLGSRTIFRIWSPFGHHAAIPFRMNRASYLRQRHRGALPSTY